MSPDSPTFYSRIPGHRSDVLGIALMKLSQQSINIANINDISSDHNPIMLNISDSPITSTPPRPKQNINWKKYSSSFIQKINNTNPHADTVQNINLAIHHLSNSIKSAVEENTFVHLTELTSITQYLLKSLDFIDFNQKPTQKRMATLP